VTSFTNLTRLQGGGVFEWAGGVDCVPEGVLVRTVVGFGVDIVGDGDSVKLLVGNGSLIVVNCACSVSAAAVLMYETGGSVTATLGGMLQLISTLIIMMEKAKNKILFRYMVSPYL